MRINHNSLALNASDHFSAVNEKLAKSISRLSSGYKITSPADDAAGLAISTKMDAQIRGLDRAAQNSNDGISVIESAEGGLSEIHSILGRLRELAVQAANDVECEEDRDSIQEEVNNLLEEINQLTSTTTFNDNTLLDGSLTRRTLASSEYLHTTYLSESVNTGVYNIEVTKLAEQAVYEANAFSGTITKDQAGTLTINGFSVEIEEGMTENDVYDALQEHLYKINVDVFASADGGETPGDFGSGPVYFRTKDYGSDQKIEIGCSNPMLEAYLGVIDKDKVEGVDCQATIDTSKSTEGFKETASVSFLGNDITIVDRNGFEMRVSVDDTVPDGDVPIKSSLEVLSAGVMVIQTGANSGEQIELDIPAMNTKGLNLDNLIMYTHEYANDAIARIDAAVKTVSSVRSKLGAYQNRLEDIYDGLEIQGQSLTEAYSRIMDTDMAEEMTLYTEQDVISQAALSMLQKSNERPEQLLQLLQ